MPTKADDWRARARQSAIDEAVDLTLPSGITIRARRPDALQLATWGRLPLTLAALVSKTTGQASEVSDTDAIEAMAFVRDLLLTCCIDPRVTLTPQAANEIHPRDIPQQDWVFLLAWAMRWAEASALESFRNQRSSPGPGSDGKNVVQPPERPPGDSGSGSRSDLRPGDDSAYARTDF